MGFGVFVHRFDSIYDDDPAVQYQFPRQYLSRVQACIGDWIVYYEPTKVADTRGYFAVAKVEQVIPDPNVVDMFIAVIELESYLDLPNPVPFVVPEGVVEQGLLNDAGRISGRAQSAVRPLSLDDFNRILTLGLGESEPMLPRIGDVDTPLDLQDAQEPFIFEQDRARLHALYSRPRRDSAFRSKILRAYGERCAVSGLKLINGGGRAEVNAAHIRPVEERGPDSVRNGLALSGTVHWMFDRGLISLSDDLRILVSRHVNNLDSVGALINETGHALRPLRDSDRPHPKFLEWHRQERFKE